MAHGNRHAVLVLAAFGFMTAFAAPALALDVSEKLDTALSADAIWQKIGDFCGIAKWHPAVKNCTLSQKDGVSLRLLDLGGGATVLEKLVSRDDAKRTYTYDIVEGVLPVANYTSTLTVNANGTGSTIVWIGKFDAKGTPDAKAQEVISGIYKAGQAALAAK